MANSYLVDKVRVKLKSLAGIAEERLQALLDRYEEAAHLAHYPEKLVEGRSERFKAQVKKRSDHWAEKCYLLEKRLERAVEKP